MEILQNFKKMLAAISMICSGWLHLEEQAVGKLSGICCPMIDREDEKRAQMSYNCRGYISYERVGLYTLDEGSWFGCRPYGFAVRSN